MALNRILSLNARDLLLSFETTSQERRAWAQSSSVGQVEFNAFPSYYNCNPFGAAKALPLLRVTSDINRSLDARYTKLLMVSLHRSDYPRR